MRFSKPALTPRQQLDRLIDHGLQIRDANRALRLLEVTSYFRLIPYMRPYQQLTTEGRRFQVGLGLDRIYSLYQFDSSLRQLAMAEELSLGGISHLYSGLARDRDRKEIARCFQVPQRVLGSWLHTLTFIRNICAHHARLWNRELAVPARWDRRLPEPDGNSGPQPPRRFFTVAAMLTYLCRRVSPDSRWQESFIALIKDYPDVPRGPMGFPEYWDARLRQYGAADDQAEN